MYRRDFALRRIHYGRVHHGRRPRIDLARKMQQKEGPRLVYDIALYFERPAQDLGSQGAPLSAAARRR
eukprot:1197711-Pyramimonas_sp.AAC.1